MFKVASRRLKLEREAPGLAYVASRAGKSGILREVDTDSEDDTPCRRLGIKKKKGVPAEDLAHL